VRPFALIAVFFAEALALFFRATFLAGRLAAILADFAFAFVCAGFFPAFLTALIWIKGRSFFNLRVLFRLAGYGCGGLSLYLVSPLVHYLDDPQSYGFWEMFRGNLSYQKTNLLAFNYWRQEQNRRRAKCRSCTKSVHRFLPILVRTVTGNYS
jgi:hypothetical protein